MDNSYRYQNVQNTCTTTFTWTTNDLRVKRLLNKRLKSSEVVREISLILV
jgi:hypothetical protein